MKSVLRCQNKPKAVGFSIIGLLIDRKKSVAVCGPLKRPGQAFSWLSISQCFDFFQRRKATDGGQRGDVIRWSVFDLPSRFALNSFFALDLLFIRFLAQDRGYPDYYYPLFTRLLRLLAQQFRSNLSHGDFVTSLFSTAQIVIQRTLFTPETGNPIFLIIRLSFGLFLLFVVYRVIKRAISKV